MRFSQTLKFLREQHCLTQAELAEKLLITQAHVNRLENEVREPSTKLLIRVAKTFDTTTDALLGIENVTNEAI